MALFEDKLHVTPGIDFLAERFKLDEKISAADYIITGEGSFDNQTLQGKLVDSIISRSLIQKKPCLVLCGRN